MASDGVDEQGITTTPDTAGLEARAESAAPAPQGISHEFSAGARIGDYVIARTLASGAAPRYLAHKATSAMPATTSAMPDEPAAQPVELIAGDPGAFEGVRVITSRGLRHAHLLAPRAIISWDGRDYLVVDACEAQGEAVAPLDATTALTAGVDLADALVYLHRSGVAHQRVSPEAVAFCDGTAYLTGLQHAQPLHPADPDAVGLFARDANFLARTLGALAQGALAQGARDAASEPDASDSQAAALAAIVERAESNEYRSPAEVGAACVAALPSTAPDRAVMSVPTRPMAPATLPATSSEMGATPSASAQLRFTVATAMSVGRVRSENQDAAATALFEVRDDVHAGLVATMPAGVFLVADGMGGEERGDLASRIAARTMLAEAARGLLLPVVEGPVQAARSGVNDPQVMLPNLEEILIHAGRAANSEVRKLAALLGKTTGSTLTAVAAVGGRAAFIHIGDSRAYLLHDGETKQLTEDHTLLARLQKTQHPLLQELGFSVPRSYLYRSLGQDDKIELDAGSFTLHAGDRLMLCSDGLWDEVSAERIATVLAGATTPQQCADALVAAANDHGGNDNSSVVVVFVGQQAAIA